jgi:hypothetical protein
MPFKDSLYYKAPGYLLTRLLLFLSRLLKSLWLFFPGILFIALAIWCFWTLGQGKDIIVAFTENAKAKSFFFIAVAFWVYVSWYSARIVAYLKQAKQEDYIKNIISESTAEKAEKKLQQFSYFELPPVWLTVFPRIIGYACLLAIELAVLQSPVFGDKAIASGKAMFLFVLGLIISWGLDDRVKKFADTKRTLARIIFYILLGIFVVTATLGVINPTSGLMFLFWVILILHAVYLFYINLRRKKVEQNEIEIRSGQRPLFLIRWIYVVMKFLRIPPGEVGYFNWFNIVGITGLIIYISTIESLNVSWKIGPFPFVLIAFAVLLGFGNILTALSVKVNLNFHFLLFLLAFLLGSSETHYIRTKSFDNAADHGIYNKRQDIYTYFTHWVNSRAAAIDSADSYPVYFVLANGGASRSGYWTASVLSKLEDTTRSKGSPLSQHLFCLSGTSGGGVGVATFFSLLYERNKLPDSANVSFLKPAKSFLKKDFLTHTLAHMLGPDYFKYIFHINNRSLSDRAGALEETIEEGARQDSGLLKVGMDEPLSKMLALNSDTQYRLPVLCINTTRMQDGNPGVVTNIMLNEDIFNKRVDVAGILNDTLDMRLSTASIMGARFPYISPAGRIDEWLPMGERFRKDDSIMTHYFVDGGYFDNSGAGVVQEMIRAILNFTAKSTDEAFKNRVRKLHLTILHITNSPQGVADIQPVDPLQNDLLAPVLTIVGAYNMQTTVNDNRLVNFIQDIGATGICQGADYYPIHLYKDSEEKRAQRKLGDTLKEIPYAMNWFISDTTLKRMDNRLLNQPKLNALIKKLVP